MANKDALSQRAKWSGGQPIGYLMHMALARPRLISLAAGFVDQTSLPAEETKVAMESVLSDPSVAHAALQYGTTHGYAPLREQILARLQAADGSKASEMPPLERMILTAGSNQLLHLVADTLLNPGDIVLTAAPTYFVFLGVLANLGARAIGVASDENGLIPEALDTTLQQLAKSGELSRVKAIYTVSYFDNPGSVSLSAARRPQLVEIAQRWSQSHKIYLIDDAAYRELRYAGEDIPSLLAADPSNETVIHTGTFSKSFAPGIRVGWGIVPAELVEPMVHQKGNIDFGSPNLSQHVMSKVLDLGLYDPHISRLRGVYQTKLTAMVQAAEKYLSPIDGTHWQVPTGGLYVWLAVPESVDTGTDGALFQRALDQGVIYVPGHYCYPSEGVPVPTNRIRLSFGVQSPEKIEQGMELLALAIRDVA
ncbi:MAG: PLP-dependent aminotransferase family protein [Planctomycetota bacterium]|nr:PLP-dependent aminotransferase family protein [Planctomycetota bacterium]